MVSSAWEYPTLLLLPYPRHCGWCQPLPVPEPPSSRLRYRGDWIWSRDPSLVALGKFIPQAVPLFIYAIRHTNLLAMALESKGFSPESPRTLYYEPHMRTIDYIVLILLGVILMALLYIRLVLHLGAIIPGRL